MIKEAFKIAGDFLVGATTRTVDTTVNALDLNVTIVKGSASKSELAVNLGVAAWLTAMRIVTLPVMVILNGIIVAEERHKGRKAIKAMNVRPGKTSFSL